MRVKTKVRFYRLGRSYPGKRSSLRQGREGGSGARNIVTWPIKPASMDPNDKLKLLSEAPPAQEAVSEQPGTNVTTQPAVQGVGRLKALSRKRREQEPPSEEAPIKAVTTQPAVIGVDKLKALSQKRHEQEETSEEASTEAVTGEPAVQGVDKRKAITKKLQVKRTTEHPTEIPAGTEQTIIDDEKPKTTPATRGATAHVVNLKMEECRETPPATQGATGPSPQAVGQVNKKSRGSGSRGSSAGRRWTSVGLCLKLFSALLVTGVGVFFIWPELEQEIWSKPRKEVRSELGSDVRSKPEEEVQSKPEREVQSEQEKEVCEFLARPAAKLFIDGKLASEEVPPIYRTQLELGEHTIRFVSPENRTNEKRIDVVKGLPTRWFMNWAEGRVDERRLNPEKEAN